MFVTSVFVHIFSSEGHVIHKNGTQRKTVSMPFRTSVLPIFQLVEYRRYCHYVVFDLARGGDLLEALKKKPRGFPEEEARSWSASFEKA